MKKLFLLMLALILSWPTIDAKKEKEELIPQYQMEGAGMTSDNAQQVSVTILSKKKEDVSDADLSKCGVHGILFRDYDDATNSGYGSIASHKSIMGGPEKMQEHIDFFTPFFSNGDYLNYVQLVEDTRRVVKSGKQWKVSAVVRVNASALKKLMEKQGWVKNLGSGW